MYFLQQPNRIGICVLSIHDDIVPSVDMYLLQQANEQVTNLYVGYRGKNYSEKVEQQLSLCSNHVVFLEEQYSDLYAYRIMFENMHLKDMETCDELWLFDNSFLGPLYDLSKLFDKMQREDCDFWGLMYCPPQLDENWNTMSGGLNSGFLVVRSNLFKQRAFKCFFSEKGKNMSIFWSYFSQLGYQGKTYIDVSDYISVLPQNNFEMERYISFQLIKDYKYPFLKKECFRLKKDDFEYGINENLSKTMGYIRDFVDYDIEMLWDYVLSNVSVTELYQLLHFNYVLPYQIGIEDKRFCRYPKTGIIIHLYYMDLLDEVFSYIVNIPTNIDIIITSEKQNHTLLHRYTTSIGREDIILLSVGDKGRDIAALLITARDYLMKYEYLCFIHDKKTTSNSGPITVGADFRYTIWENLLKSKNYIKNILETFHKNSRLGVLAPPAPFHGEYFSLVGNKWAGSKKATEDLLRKLNINMRLDNIDDPFILSSSFWCRTAALKDLFEYPFKYEDFPDEPLPLDGTLSHAVERCLIYVAQKNGYFSGTIENADYASIYISNLQRMLSTIVRQQSTQHYFTSFNGLVESCNKAKLIDFCKEKNDIYVYGAGLFGLRVLATLNNQGIGIKGFIVSDGQTKKTDLKLPCYYLSEIKISNKVGIIIAATKIYKAEMVKNLLKRGWDQFFCENL